ncbi:MAG: hypothetical protein ACFFAL_08520 [Promethearchaeota archaeon]
MKTPQISHSKIILFGILFLFMINLVHATYSELSWQYGPENGRAFVDALGYMGLSIPSECLSSRNPFIEPTCLPDIPGGYCYHASCGKVAPTYIGKNYTIEVVRP